ncbi:MAG: A/G-specific adenine glycosylase [Promethearchaeota archaeon]
MLIHDFYKTYKREGLTSHILKTFQGIIYSYYKRSGRNFPFRTDISPYNVLISEIMLQQTQTSRVADKFLEFINKFPNFNELANAKTNEILKVWQGLGYNRRALALKKIAKIVVNEYEGKLPEDINILKSFPQIGHNTASSILTFSFNKPTYFVETNIRRVYIHFFFRDKNLISDEEILPLVKKTLDFANPREWYYALMDYGVMLKKTHPELHKKSTHYRKQAKFEGSNREIRGKVLKMILREKNINETEIFKEVQRDRGTIREILNVLEDEGFMKKNGQNYYILE